jgi:hypothetical protein
MGLLIAIAAFVVVPFVVLCLVRGLDNVIEGMPRLEDLFGRFRRVRIWQLVLAFALLMLVVSIASADSALALVVASLALVVAFARIWVHEFWSLMALRDDDFPGRFDKLVWAALLVLVAPLGVWLFRSYRLVHWPDTEPVRAKAMEPEVI